MVWTSLGISLLVLIIKNYALSGAGVNTLASCFEILLYGCGFSDRGEFACSSSKSSSESSSHFPYSELVVVDTLNDLHHKVPMESKKSNCQTQSLVN